MMRAGRQEPLRRRCGVPAETQVVSDFLLEVLSEADAHLQRKGLFVWR
jgi:hypothetical protein